MEIANLMQDEVLRRLNMTADEEKGVWLKEWVPPVGGAPSGTPTPGRCMQLGYTGEAKWFPEASRSR
jgi:hypothetical protein